MHTRVSEEVANTRAWKEIAQQVLIAGADWTSGLTMPLQQADRLQGKLALYELLHQPLRAPHGRLGLRRPRLQSSFGTDLESMKRYIGAM